MVIAQDRHAGGTMPAALAVLGRVPKMLAPTLTKVLIVVHGNGRGRGVPTGNAFLKRLAATGNGLLQDIRVHHTGTGEPDFSDVGLVFFWLGDPLKQKYPDCYRDALEIAEQARRLGLALINHPDALSNTAKSRQADIWTAAGIPSAAARSVRTRRQLVQAMKEMGLPCIVRSDHEHTQRGVSIINSEAGLDAVDLDEILPAVVLQLHDVRAEYRRSGADPSNLFCRYHHKARAFVFRDHAMPSHLFFSESPIVSLSNCLFARAERPRRRLARKLGYHRRLVRDLVDADRAYFGQPLAGKAELVRAVSVLGLDFAAVDYSLRPDGSVILWEVNPYFHMPEGQFSVLSRQRDAVRRVNQSFDWMAHCFELARTRNPLPMRLASS